MTQTDAKENKQAIEIACDQTEPGRASPHQGVQLMVNTARNRTLPVIIRLYASATLARGNVSIIGRTPESALNRKVSSESMAVPEGQPCTDLRAPMRSRALIESGSSAA